MNGLRVFINTESMGMPGKDWVFYSRREDGPYYRWRYEEKIGRWCVSRVHHGLVPKALCITAWATVPTSLRAMLSEHYLE